MNWTRRILKVYPESWLDKLSWHNQNEPTVYWKYSTNWYQSLVIFLAIIWLIVKHDEISCSIVKHGEISWWIAKHGEITWLINLDQLLSMVKYFVQLWRILKYLDQLQSMLKYLDYLISMVKYLDQFKKIQDNSRKYNIISFVKI